MPRECMCADYFPCPGLFEPFGRTFVGLQFWHDNVPGKYQSNINSPRFDRRGTGRVLNSFGEVGRLMSLSGHLPLNLSAGAH